MFAPLVHVWPHLSTKERSTTPAQKESGNLTLSPPPWLVNHLPFPPLLKGITIPALLFRGTITHGWSHTCEKNFQQVKHCTNMKCVVFKSQGWLYGLSLFFSFKHIHPLYNLIGLSYWAWEKWPIARLHHLAWVKAIQRSYWNAACFQRILLSSRELAVRLHPGMWRWALPPMNQGGAMEEVFPDDTRTTEAFSLLSRQRKYHMTSCTLFSGVSSL